MFAVHKFAMRKFRKALLLAMGSLVPVALAGAVSEAAAPSFAEVVDRTQPKMVKIYGAGGLQRLESYQSGMLISAEGHILTALSYVLDTDGLSVTLDDGRRYQAELLGGDPQLEIAVLKIDAEGLAHFDLADAVTAEAGRRVLAFSNLFGVATGNEPASVQRGVIALRTDLKARRGTYQLPYRGEVYVLDAITSNPGAAGGALTDQAGRLLGLLGKEVRSVLTGTWLSYALPADKLTASVDQILAGKDLRRTAGEGPRPVRSLSLSALGVLLVPDVLDRTPPFIDAVLDGSPADAKGLERDDLIVFLDDQLTQSIRQLRERLDAIEFDAPVKITVMRGQQLIDVQLQAPLNE